jgi:arylsulfatase A-like enzyme
VDRDHLVRRCTEEAVAFMERNRDRPFFLYLPHTMPGSTPHPFSSPAFRGRSANGAYGDAVEELDWSTGQILAALQRLDVERKTLVIWTSDNGAVARQPPQGSNAPYRGAAYNTSEAATRMPCVMRWPGRMPAGAVQDELCTTMDLLPTLARLAGAELPAAALDGHDIRPLIFGEPGARSPWDEVGFGYYLMEQLQAVRAGPWKLYLPLDAKLETIGRKIARAKEELYDVRHDVGETREVSADHPDVVARLTAMAERLRRDMGDSNRSAPGQRPAGLVANPRPLVPVP